MLKSHDMLRLRLLMWAGLIPGLAAGGCQLETEPEPDVELVAQAPQMRQGLAYYPLVQPIRFLDTRLGTMAVDPRKTPIVIGEVYHLFITGRPSYHNPPEVVPTTAQVVVGLVTQIDATGPGGLRLFAGATVPRASHLVVMDASAVGTGFTVKLDAQGALNIQQTAPQSDVVIDVIGYYAPPTTGALYFHRLPRAGRCYDSRPSGKAKIVGPGPIPGGSVVSLDCTGTYPGPFSVTIPTEAQVLVGQSAALDEAAAGLVKVWPSNIVDPDQYPAWAHDIFVANQIKGTELVTSIGADHIFKVRSTTTFDYIVDIVGYFSLNANDDGFNGPGLQFFAFDNAVRILDNRIGASAYYQPNASFPPTSTSWTQVLAHGISWAGETIPTSTVEASGTAPASAAAVSGVIMAVNAPYAATGNVLVNIAGQDCPSCAGVAFYSGQNVLNGFMMPLADGAFQIQTTSSTDVLIELNGYFAQSATTFPAPAGLDDDGLVTGVPALSSAADGQLLLAPWGTDDNKADLIVVKLGNPTSSVDVYSGDQFTTKIVSRLIATATSSGWVFRAVDWNHDGIIDLVGINRQGSSGKVEVTVWNGIDFGVLRATTVTAQPGVGSTIDLDIADWNNDGAMDLAVLGRSPSQISILDGATSFSTYLVNALPTWWVTNEPSARLFLRDWNGDHHPDLIALSPRLIRAELASQRHQITVWSGSDGSFSHPIAWSDILLDTSQADSDFDLASWTRPELPIPVSLHKTGTPSSRMEITTSTRPDAVAHGDLSGVN